MKYVCMNVCAVFVLISVYRYIYVSKLNDCINLCWAEKPLCHGNGVADQYSHALKCLNKFMSFGALHCT